MEYLLGGKKFTYASAYRDDSSLRESFNALARQVYNFDFESWYAAGYWPEGYIPCSLVHQGAVVANASVNLMDFLVWGEKRRYLQIGTVMTDPAFRGLGLSRLLLEKILADWAGKYRLLYLFANDSVRGFYPKFGFSAASEYLCAKAINRAYPGATAQKVDMGDELRQRDMVEKIQSAKPLREISMLDSSSLVMFYCTMFMRDNVYYLPQQQAYAVAEIADGVLRLHDLFCGQELPLDEAIAALAPANITRVELGFTPRDKSGFREAPLKEEDTTLFMLGQDAPLFQQRQVRFPVLSRA